MDEEVREQICDEGIEGEVVKLERGGCQGWVEAWEKEAEEEILIGMAARTIDLLG